MSARRKLKSLETLARARDLELDDLRRVAAQAGDKVRQTEQVMAAVENAIHEEASMLGEELHLRQAYVAYAGNARSKLEKLAVLLEHRRAELADAEAKVLDGYRALKQIEEAAKARRAEIEAEEARKERAAADDLAAIRATRTG